LQSRTSRKEKRKQEQGTTVESGLRLDPIKPKTENQRAAFRDYEAGDTLFLHGLPGTGKTFVALYLALKSVINEKTHRRVVIVRSAVPTRDIGFLPGSAAEKMRAYEAPYAAICAELFGRGDAYEVLKQKKLVEFIPTSFIRGVTIDDAVVIIEEGQNMSRQEIRSVVTRVGENSRVIVAADASQDDLTSKRYSEESGIDWFIKVMKRMPCVSFIDFVVEDIVRSGFVKSFILAEYDIIIPRHEEQEAGESHADRRQGVLAL
jgi:phosphate starvation-inducible protein PhoH